MRPEQRPGTPHAFHKSLVLEIQRGNILWREAKALEKSRHIDRQHVRQMTRFSHSFLKCGEMRGRNIHRHNKPFPKLDIKTARRRDSEPRRLSMILPSYSAIAIPGPAGCGPGGNIVCYRRIPNSHFHVARLKSSVFFGDGSVYL